MVGREGKTNKMTQQASEEAALSTALIDDIYDERIKDNKFISMIRLHPFNET